VQLGLRYFRNEFRPLELLATLRDYFIADLADENDKVCVRLVVVRGVLDQHDEVHNRDLDLLDLRDGVAEALQLLEVLLQCREEALVVFGLVLGLRHLLLQFVEGADVVRGLTG